MSIIEEGAVVGIAGVAVVLAGVIAYKIIKKRKPQLLRDVKKSASGLNKKTSEMAAAAREAFREGYAQA